MKPMAERNPVKVGVVGSVVIVAAIVGATNYDAIPFLGSGHSYTAQFADAAGLRADSPVEVAGLRVGQVSSIRLDGDRVVVGFDIDRSVFVGDRSEAAIKTKTVLGAKVVEVTPRGDAPLEGPIPLELTTSPYQLADALGDLSVTINGLDTDELSTSLQTLAETFADTPPELRAAVDGVSRLSGTLAERDTQLRSLLSDVGKVSTVLGQRSSQIVDLITNSNALLTQIRTQSAALDSISNSIVAVSRQIRGFIAENRESFTSTLDRLNGVLAIIDNRRERLQDAVKRLNSYAMALGESVSSGPFFKGFVVNLPPGQYIQPFIDAAFSDLGLDPNVLAPSQLTDPPVGQPGTPAMPAPFPRTGQGGPPRMTVPDAITGNPGDLGCGPPGLPLPGPTGCYPYREPIPAPAPGGPPPGPPAPGDTSPVPPTHGPVFVPAPGETPTGGGTDIEGGR
ncbi:phospholipid/cholesterol/gamma-HCH transport system substrate-binding protein [Mycobacterium sp. 88mf]|nr:phospholipid/cholesterol/gamma-HCH transport system substrate-binding protein [Mycobacterium sp. 88mf]SFF04770.1 phospholipid/cholesterol/gamma-HCH transport system substrate-binding protein [Mycobacterium sp. 455mf]